MRVPGVRAHLVRPGRPAVALGTYVAAGLAWIVLVFHDAVEHAVFGHDHLITTATAGPGTVEAAAAADGLVGVGHYMAMWGTMMVAMMYPSSAATFQWYADRTAPSRSVDAVLDVSLFAGAYTLLWVLVGVVPLAANAVVRIAQLADRWGTLYFGVAFLAVGAFQLSPAKRRYLDRCRTPSGLLAGDARSGETYPARSGLAFALLDVGACGVLMGLMVVVGSMHLGWMTLITIVLALERTTQRGQFWARATGLLALASGAALVVVRFL